jgi:hypothetical protein
MPCDAPEATPLDYSVVVGLFGDGSIFRFGGQGSSLYVQVNQRKKPRLRSIESTNVENLPIFILI